MNSRPTIAVVGASVRATAFSLLRAGCQVVAADLFADADLSQVCPVTRITDYPAGLADWLAHTPCAGWLYTGALENHPDLIDRLTKLRPLCGNHGAVLRQVRDPLALQDMLLQAGLSFPETKSSDGTSPGVGEWLHKTGRGGNGSGVSLAATAEPSLTMGLTPGYWQKHIEGHSGSALYIAGKLRCITRQLVGESWLRSQPFQYCGTLAPWRLPETATTDLVRVGEVLAEQGGLLGLFGVDFVFDGTRAAILEVNPRTTAAVEVAERVLGQNLLAEHLAAMGIHVGNTTQPCVPAAGKTILYAKHPLEISRHISKQLLIAAGDWNHPQLADIPAAETQIAPRDPILTVLSQGNNLDDVESDLRERVALLEAELYSDGGGQ